MYVPVECYIYYDVRLSRNVTEGGAGPAAPVRAHFTIIVLTNYVCIYAQWSMEFDICDDKKKLYTYYFKIVDHVIFILKSFKM